MKYSHKKPIGRKMFALLLSIFCLMGAVVPFSGFADTALRRTSDKSSIYCWSLFLMNKGSFSDARTLLQSLNVGRVYQKIPSLYLEREETASMVSRLNANGIETVALMGDRAWGLEENDLAEPKEYIDSLAAYNQRVGGSSKVGAIALDVETYTYSSWKDDRVTFFETYIEKMRVLYDYAHSKGLSVIQVIPVHFDSIDETLMRRFVSECCDELSLMNYNKSTQVKAIKGEVAICRELGIPVETIFETMPYSEYYSVTEEITYYYEGLEALNAKKNEILDTYGSDGLSVSYHHLDTMYHVVTGRYIAEIYGYTDKNDPNRNKLGQTDALDTIILTGDDGSVITAGLYNPNRGAQYEESCYLAFGVSPDVTYTVSAGSASYTVPSPAKTFAIEENEPVVYTSIRVQYTGETPPEEPDEPEEPDIDLSILGASIRLSEPYGIRFGIRLGKGGDFGNVPIVEYGTLMKPTQLLGEEELTLDTPNVRRIPGKTIYSETDAERIYTGVLINIPAERLDEAISGRGYLIYQDADGGSHTIYTDTVTRSFHDVVELAYKHYSSLSHPTDAQLAVLAKLEKLRA